MRTQQTQTQRSLYQVLVLCHGAWLPVGYRRGRTKQEARRQAVRDYPKQTVAVVPTRVH